MKVEYTQEVVDELAEMGLDFFEETTRAIYSSVSQDIEIEFVKVEDKGLHN